MFTTFFLHVDLLLDCVLPCVEFSVDFPFVSDIFSSRSGPEGAPGSAHLLGMSIETNRPKSIKKPGSTDDEPPQETVVKMLKFFQKRRTLFQFSLRLIRCSSEVRYASCNEALGAVLPPVFPRLTQKKTSTTWYRVRLSLTD